jgi:catechol-2,3-dioxygenase
MQELSKIKSAVKAIGEIALQVNDLDVSQKFYEEVIGLSLMKRFDHAAFFNIAEGVEGHTQILALFKRDVSVSQSHTTLDHIAFSISLFDFDREVERIQGHGIEIQFAEHEWVHWRSLFVKDPDGNSVEFVCYDESVK